MKKVLIGFSLLFFLNSVGAQSPILTLNVTIGHMSLAFDPHDTDSPYPYIDIALINYGKVPQIFALTLYAADTNSPETLLNKQEMYVKSQKDMAAFTGSLEAVIKSDKYKTLGLIDDGYNEYYFDIATMVDSIATLHQMVGIAKQNSLLAIDEKNLVVDDILLPPRQHKPDAASIAQAPPASYGYEKFVPHFKDSVTIRKAEKGSASDTVLGGAQGTVGQNIYNPVYLNLPPPRSVSAALYNNIPDLVMPPNTVIYSAAARKKAFLSYYVLDGSVYRLKSDVPLDQRDPLWQILEDAGYDAAQADYKQGKNLSPVVIGFTVTSGNQLKGVEILQSSGYPDIDGAVLYGFKRGVYWNQTGEAVLGRFTYRF